MRMPARLQSSEGLAGAENIGEVPLPTLTKLTEVDCGEFCRFCRFASGPVPNISACSGVQFSQRLAPTLRLRVDLKLF